MADNGTNLCYLTIAEAGELIRRQELSPVEFTRAFLDRIDAVDDRLHAFITVLRNEALEEARTAEAEILDGNYRGPLHGIPLAHKDLYDTAGVRTTAGSKVYMDRVPTDDATVIARLRAAGSVLLGKLSMHEFALGGPDFSTPFPPARNPWNLDHVPRWLQQWVRRCGGRGTMHGGTRLLHRRIDSWSRISVRHSGPQSDLRAGEPR